MTLTLSPDQRRTLAARLGVDSYDMDAARLVREAGDLADRAGRSYADSDQTGVLGLERTAPMTGARVTAMTSVGEAAIDAAVGRGAIEQDDRPTWRRRFLEDAQFAQEVLAALPSNKALADRAYAEDQRLNDLGDALDGYMGVTAEDRVARDFDEDAGLPDSERLYRWLADSTNADR